MMDATQNSQEPDSTLNQAPKKQQQSSPSPSPLSSPSHEFSFTITLHPSPNNAPTIKRTNNHLKDTRSIALDLAPADDIFFHGHLLPLHLLHPPPPSTPLPPRPSTDNPQHAAPAGSTLREGGRKKSGSLSRLAKWFEDKKKKTKSIFELFLFSSSSSKSDSGRRDLRDKRRPYTFSGNSNKDLKWAARRRGEFSAPASMRTSPTNSGLLLATPAGYASSNESSMEELQSAIQAAIAHCKNSTAAAAEERKGGQV